MKRFIGTFMLASIVLTSNVYATEIPNSFELEKSSKAIEYILKSEKKLSLENAMKLAEVKITKDPLYTEKLKELNKIQEENIDKYGEPERKIDDLGNPYYKYPYGEPSYNITKEIIDLEESMEDSIKAVRNNVKSLYFNIVEAKQNTAIAKGKLDIATDELEKARHKLSLGTIIQSDVVSKEANVSSAKANYENAKGSMISLFNQFETAIDVTKIYGVSAESINFDISSVLVNTSENLQGSYTIPNNLDKKAKEAYKSLADLKKTLEDKEEALNKITNGYNEDSVYYYNKHEELGIRTLKDEVADAERNLTIDFSSDSKRLTDNIAAFQNEKDTFELSRKRIDQVLVKYNTGQIQKTEYLKEKLSYDESKLRYENSLKDIYILVDNYNEKYNL